MAFTLSYISYYGEVPLSHTVTTLSASDLPTLTTDDYEFNGWYYDLNHTDIAEVGDTLSGDTVLYAKWTSGNKYTARMSSNIILEQVGSTTASIRYGSVEIPSPVQDHDVTLLTQGKIVENQITLDGQNIGVTDKVYSSNVVISAIKFLSPPVIGVVGNSIYVLDTTEGSSDEIDITASSITIGTMYRINQTVENVTSSSTSYTFISSAVPVQIVYTPTTGYTLPSSVTVTNATYEWDSISGVLTLSEPTDIVSVTVRGVAE